MRNDGSVVFTDSFPPRRILVPVDFSSCAREALRYALALAETHDAAVYVLHVYTLDEYFAYDPAVDSPRAAVQQQLLQENRACAQHLLQRLVDELEGHTSIAEVKLTESMAIAPAIISYARQYAADWIVMGTHGWRGIRHLVLGSVAEEVVRDASCPVLLIREEEGSSPTLSLQRILVPTDFSEASEVAIALGARIARAYASQLDLLHIIEPLPFSGALTGFMTVHDMVPKISDRSQAKLKLLRASLVDDDVPTRLHMMEGYPATRIHEAAEALSADLIVMTTRGLSAWQRLFIGSVVARVVRTTACPVLVLPYPPAENDLESSDTKVEARGADELQREHEPSDGKP